MSPGSDGNAVLDAALSYAARGWPVFPCGAGRKIPATAHGYLDATTDPEQIWEWFGGHPDRNLAIATGAPGPDVLDVDQHGRAGNGFAALNQLYRAGMLAGSEPVVRTPGGGLHVYFTGSDQRTGYLPRHHLDFRACGGSVLAPPSRVSGRPYQLVKAGIATRGLDWAQVRQLLQPDRETEPTQQVRLASGDLDRLATWLAAQETGNRNAGLFWAANRALEANPDADLAPLAAAARQAGLGDREIQATLNSARRITQHRPIQTQHSPEAEPK
jgi:hypothetical protein